MNLQNDFLERKKRPQVPPWFNLEASGSMISLEASLAG
jgi:hypothetical protein